MWTQRTKWYREYEKRMSIGFEIQCLRTNKNVQKIKERKIRYLTTSIVSLPIRLPSNGLIFMTISIDFRRKNQSWNTNFAQIMIKFFSYPGLKMFFLFNIDLICRIFRFKKITYPSSKHHCDHHHFFKHWTFIFTFSFDSFKAYKIVIFIFFSYFLMEKTRMPVEKLMRYSLRPFTIRHSSFY